MPLVVLLVAAAGLRCAAGGDRDRTADEFPGTPVLATGAAASPPRAVFVIVLENEDWATVEGNPSAPYINGTLLPRFAHAESYRNGGLHPSLPSYIALEAGDPLGVGSDESPRTLRLPVSAHLASYLDAVGLSWRAYLEGIDGHRCPLDDTGRYAAHHEPFLYFDDVTGNPPDPGSATCLRHVRPYAELASDLAAGTVASYSFIAPDVCHDGHDACPPEHDRLAQADAWLAREVPALTASPAWRSGGVLFIVWDEPATGDHPVGLIAISPLARAGYASTTPASHASLLRTVQEMLGVTPLLRRAASAGNLSDLFTSYP